MTIGRHHPRTLVSTFQKIPHRHVLDSSFDTAKLLFIIISFKENTSISKDVSFPTAGNSGKSLVFVPAILQAKPFLLSIIRTFSSISRKISPSGSSLTISNIFFALTVISLCSFVDVFFDTTIEWSRSVADISSASSKKEIFKLDKICNELLKEQLDRLFELIHIIRFKYFAFHKRTLLVKNMITLEKKYY